MAGMDNISSPVTTDEITIRGSMHDWEPLPRELHLAAKKCAYSAASL
jgi:hypothetical protein